MRVARQKLAAKSKGEFYCCGLQSWVPRGDQLYDIIWVQWVCLYLTDDHFVQFLDKCTKALTRAGIVYFKDNCTGYEGFQLDADDNSICRSDAMYRTLFERAGWTLVADEIQQHFPQELYEVRMYALRPP